MILCDDRATFCIISYIQVSHFKTKIYRYVFNYLYMNLFIQTKCETRGL